MLRRYVLVTAAVAFVAAVLPRVAPAQDTPLSLVMFEQSGCNWCARWNAEIAPIYPKTAEGRLAPLLRLNIHDPLPVGVALTSRPLYTPTFVLIRDGHELARIEGYPGEAFFWGLLEKMLIKHAEFVGAS